MSVYSTQPVPNDYSDFYGKERIQVVGRIISGLQLHEPRSWAIYGGRRMGKTSTCYKVHQQLSCRYNKDEACFIPVYIDLSAFTLESKRYFFYIMASRLLKAIREQEILSKDALSSPETINIFKLDRTHDPVIDFKEFYNLVMGEVVPAYRQVRVIFLFDEVDHLSKPKWGNEILAHLRAIIKTRSEFKYASYTALAMAGTSKSLSRLLAPGSPLRNELTKIVLEAFSLEDMKQLTDIYPHGTLNAKTVRNLYFLTGGHPYLVQSILGALSEQKLYPITAESLESIGQQFLAEKYVFKSWVSGDNGFSNTESEVYLELAKTSKPLPKKKIQSRVAVDELDDVLDTLICTGVVCEVTEGFQISGSLFKEWYLEQNTGEDKKPGSINNRAKKDGDMKQFIVSAFVAIFMLIATIVVLTWAAKQITGLALIFIVTVGVVFALMNIIFVLVANGIISSRQTIAFYNRILDLVPPLGKFLDKR